jgi:putative sterol carrier protein
MSKVFVFCIGGTGIRVMKSIAMLMAGGMSTNGYTVVPIILDPHLDLEEKKNLHSLIDSYENVYKRSVNNGSSTLNPLDGFFNSEIKTLQEYCGKTDDSQQEAGSKEKFRSYIELANLGSDDVNNYLVDTLFSTKNLDSPLSVGFKGNPNVGTVVLGEIIEGASWFRDFKTQCDQGDRVFIISSIFGGTGASGFPLLEKKIRFADNEPTVKNAVMGAVTVLPYYGLKDPSTTGSDIDSANFYTKTKAALAYYQGTVKSDYLYYVGEKSLKQVYDNDEKKQDDKANFIELVAASALFDFLKREKPETQQFLTRAIEDDKDSLDLNSMGDGYKDIIKSVADGMLLRQLVKTLPNESQFPLKINRGFNGNFYKDSAFQSLERFIEVYYKWYNELANNRRAFAPLHYDDENNMRGWIKGVDLEASDDSFYLLRMIEASNKEKSKEHSNKFRYFLQFAYSAIDNYTSKIYK